jgi:hypothetical protein
MAPAADQSISNIPRLTRGFLMTAKKRWRDAGAGWPFQTRAAASAAL